MGYDIFSVLVFVMTFGAFILLTLTTFSVPLASSLYFLRSSQAGGVRFGAWGWCIDEDRTCLSPLQLGYTWEPQISISITNALIFYPIAAILTFFSLISLLPTLCGKRTEKNKKVFMFFSISSSLASLLAFIFTIAMWNVAKVRFQKAGFQATFGPLPWLALVATLILLVVTFTSYRKISWNQRNSVLTEMEASHHKATPSKSIR